MTLTLCSSVSFYAHLYQIKLELEILGFKTLIPDTAQKMHQSNTFQASKTWFQTGDYSQKTQFIKDHFAKIEAGDAVLVINDDKHGLKGYIGGNVLIEMALAFYLNKPIYILNPIDDNLPFKEEVIGLNPTFIQKDLSKIYH